MSIDKNGKRTLKWLNTSPGRVKKYVAIKRPRFLTLVQNDKETKRMEEAVRNPKFDALISFLTQWVADHAITELNKAPPTSRAESDESDESED